MALRAMLWIAAGLIVGFALGGVPARRQARALRAERDALQAKLDAAGAPNLLQALLPMNTASRERLPRTDARPLQQPADGAEAATPTGEATAEATPAVTGAAGAEADAQSRRDQRRREPSLPAHFDQLVTAQRARIAAARSALIEQGELDAAQIARIDQTLSRMNDKLLGYGEEIVTQLASNEVPPALQLLGLGHDVSGILFEGQRDLEAVVGNAAKGVDRSALEIWNYVDFERLRPLVEQKARSLGGAGTSAVQQD